MLFFLNNFNVLTLSSTVDAFGSITFRKLSSVVFRLIPTSIFYICLNNSISFNTFFDFVNIPI